MKKLSTFSLTFFLIVLAHNAAFGKSIRFQCSWDDNAPISIVIDTKTRQATRSDGGQHYTVVKVTNWAVWLAIDDPHNVAGLSIQAIERAEAVGGYGKGGKWTDTVMSMNGPTSAITGGVCWEER